MSLLAASYEVNAQVVALLWCKVRSRLSNLDPRIAWKLSDYVGEQEQALLILAKANCGMTSSSVNVVCIHPDKVHRTKAWPKPPEGVTMLRKQIDGQYSTVGTTSTVPRQQCQNDGYR
jgi:hypothetical protein